MSEVAIRVNNISKLYRLGEGIDRATSLPEAAAQFLRAPFRGLRGKKAAPALEVDKQLWALRDISFDVGQGEVIGIIGHNGAGKSTLLKILSRITPPSSGEIEMRGRVASLLEVGTGFQPELTGRENIFLNGAILGMARAEIIRRFDEIVAFAEVERFVDTPVKRYSSGMYLRLAFAVAAHLDPEILIVDEVLAVGDQEFQRRCVGRMQEVSASGRTVLFVSHNMGAVSALCTRALLLRKGQVAMEGATSTVVSEYLKSAKVVGVEGCDLSKAARRGSGTARVRSFRLLDGEGNPTDRVILGDPVQFEMTFTCQERVPTPSFGIDFITADGRRVLGLKSDVMHGSLPGCEQGGRVVCRLDRMLLAAGQYQLSLGIAVEGKDELDCVEHCVGLEVLPTDIYGTGRLPSQSQSPFLAFGQWDWDYR